MNKYLKYIKFFLIFLALFSIIVFFYPIETFKEFWEISWYLLIVVMLVRPLNDIFPKCRIFSFLLKFRRELWILVWFSALAHTIGYIKIMQYDNIFWVFTDSNTWNVKWLIFWGMLALIVCIPLLLTSNWLSTKLLWKNWKTLQRGAYLMFALVAIHIYIVNWKIWPIIVITIWFILFSISYFKNNRTKKISSSWPKWLCIPCGYIYDENIWDPDSWIAPWTRFEDIPDDWLCPICWVDKTNFILIEGDIEINEGKIISLQYLTEDVIELSVDFKKELIYTYGQFLSFVLKDDMGELNRSYSIANKKWNIFTFLIKLKTDSRSSNILRNLKVWDTINWTNISWMFKLQDTNNPKVFIATGTGLAPIYSMLLNTKEEVEKKLYFWVAMQKDLFYIDNLKNIKNLELKLYISREQIEWYNYGRVNLEEIPLDEKTEIYICGSPTMVNETVSFFEKKLITKNIYFEKF